MEELLGGGIHRVWAEDLWVFLLFHELLFASFTSSEDTAPSRPSTGRCQRGRSQGQCRHAHQVASRAHKVSAQLGTPDALEAGFAKAAHGFHPAKPFFDAFADFLAEDVSSRAGGAPVQTWDLPAFGGSHMRCDAPLPTALHERTMMIPLVGSHRAGSLLFA